MRIDCNDHVISSTELQKNALQVLNCIANGSQHRYVVILDNKPTAVLLAAAKYESMMNELIHLRIEVVARDRALTLNHVNLVPHAEMSYFIPPN